MSNLKLIYQNDANTSTVTVSAAAGTLVASNLLTDIKSQVWRSTITAGTITAIWTVSKTINCVALPFTNFTNAATMRVRGYTNAADATAVFDTTALTCCPYTSPAVFGWDVNIPSVNNFGKGCSVYASLFFAGASVKKIVIDLSDTSNAAGYIEASRLVAGNSWSPTYNADYGAQVGFSENSAHTRTDAGDLITDTRSISKTLNFNFSNASSSDREALMRIMRNGISTPIYMSLFPTDTDKNLEQDYQIYGKLSQQSQVVIDRYAAYSNSIIITEV